MDFGTPFHGSAAVACGLLTHKELRGPRFRRLFRDVYLRVDVEVDLAVRSRAAFLTVDGSGVLGGYSAAELLGAPCGPAGAPAEVIVPEGHRRPQDRLRISRSALSPDEITVVGGVTVTTALCTAYHLACREPVVEAVVAVDALSRVHRFDPREIVTFGYRRLGARGSGQLPAVVRLADPRAESPMETRIRVAIVRDGLPEPALQHPVGPYRLDLAYPALRLGIEYDGRDHLDQERAMRDLARQDYLTAAGWTGILRFRKGDVLHRPRVVAGRVRQRLMLAARDRGLALHAFDELVGSGGR